MIVFTQNIFLRCTDIRERDISFFFRWNIEILRDQKKNKTYITAISRSDPIVIEMSKVYIGRVVDNKYDCADGVYRQNWTLPMHGYDYEQHKVNVTTNIQPNQKFNFFELNR